MSNRKRQHASIATLLLVCLVGRNAQAQDSPMTIKIAIETAMANNYSLKADSLNKQVAAYKVGVAKADFLPQVNFSNKMEYNPAIPSQMLPGELIGQPGKDLIPVQFGTRYGMGSGVEVNQAIVRPTSRLQVQSAVLNSQIAHTKHTLTREDLVYQVANSWYKLQATMETIRTTNKDYENIREITAIAKAQYESGVLKRIDFESLQINAANMQSKLNQLQSQYDEQLAYFKYLLGLPVETPLTLAEDVNKVPGLVEGGGAQLYNREDIHLYRQLVESKELEIKTIKAEKKPTVNAYFRFNYQSQFSNASDAFNQDYWFKSATVGISTSISLFDGYRRKHRLNIAQTELQQYHFRRVYQQELANTEWSSANTMLKNDREQVLITESNLVAAEKVYAARKALYAEGVTTLIELLDAERELSSSRHLHTQAIINVKTSLVNAHKANGTLLTGFLGSL